MTWLSYSLPVGHLTPSSPYLSAFTHLGSSCGQRGPCSMSAARMVRRRQEHIQNQVLCHVTPVTASLSQTSQIWSCVCPVCLQLLATAACCWRRAACSSSSTFIHTHRPTGTSSCWLRAFWRACNATEPALASLLTHTQAAAHHHSNLTEVKTHTQLVMCMSVSHSQEIFHSCTFSLSENMTLWSRGGH